LSDTLSPMSANGSASPTNDSVFRHRLTVVTFSLLLVVLVIHLLREFKEILEPLLIAGLIAYAILPPHRWLVRHGIGPGLSYVVLLGLLLAAFIGVGQAAYSGVSSLTENQTKLDAYEKRIVEFRSGVANLLQTAGVHDAESRMQHAIAEITPQKGDVVETLRRGVSGVASFLTFALIAFIYLIFLMAEKITFDRRMKLAFGDAHAGHVVAIAKNINEAIINYIAVKTWISLVTALMSLGVFLAFGIEFAFFWAVLVFLLNFIPYLGGLVALAPPVALGFLQHDSIWPGVAIIALLTGTQLFTGQLLEPRIAGGRLNLSPLLILLSLAFWGYLWGIPGMLLAVPLTVVIKIILDHIPETRPIATLMSNL
jgi:AI-2 transport protein TqsA